jgi:hypothetical protein
MIEFGKYNAADKLEKLRIFWQTGSNSLPEMDRTDHHKRQNLPKWESVALAGGRRAVNEHIRQVKAKIAALQTGELDHLLFEARQGRPVAGTSLCDLELASLLVSGDGATAASLGQDIAHQIRRGGFAGIMDFARIAPQVVTGLVHIFEQGMLAELSFTQDAGEIPTAEILTRWAGPFPHRYLLGMTSALCVFTTRQLGKHDVIHVHNAGIPDATLVDIDHEYMQKIKKIYSPRWSYVLSDYKEFLDENLSRHKRYDVVIADPPLPLAGDVVGESFARFLGVTGKTLILYYTTQMTYELGLKEGGMELMSERLSAMSSIKVGVREIMPRNSEISWVVLEKR